MTINEMVTKVHELAKEKGWYDTPRTALEVAALIHSEISEFVEECRKDAKPYYIENNKPEGTAVELADAVIRIMDYFGYMGWDMEAVLLCKHAYNTTRPYKHGKKC